jgi:hypothetical protein
MHRGAGGGVHGTALPGGAAEGPLPLPPGSAIAVWQVTEPPPKSELLAAPLGTPRGGGAAPQTPRRQEQPDLPPRAAPSLAGVQSSAQESLEDAGLALPAIFHEQINLSHGGAKWFDAGIRFDPASLTVG